jgi:TrmH family RNA methyltransferase
MGDGRLDNIVIVLVGTKYPGNIGSAARAMQNMGLRHLRLAAPQCAISEEAQRMARRATGILDKTRVFRSLRSALRGVRLVIGTTGKTGGHRQHACNPRSLAPRILRLAETQKVGIVFGPEDTGLVDEDLLLCQLLARIPTDPRAHSINLAQAVMLVCYELRLARLEHEPSRVLKFASVDEVEAMYQQLEKALREIGFLHDENARHMMFRLRRLLGRAGLEHSDVTILRGIARQAAWFGSRRLGAQRKVDNPSLG